MKKPAHKKPKIQKINIDEMGDEDWPKRGKNRAEELIASDIAMQQILREREQQKKSGESKEE